MYAIRSYYGYGKIFYSCSRYPQCKYALWDKPINEPCPKCGYPVVIEKVTKRFGTYRKCPTENCDWKLELIPPEKKAAPAKAKEAQPAKAAAKKPAEKSVDKPVEKKETPSKTISYNFV